MRFTWGELVQNSIFFGISFHARNNIATSLWTNKYSQALLVNILCFLACVTAIKIDTPWNLGIEVSIFDSEITIWIVHITVPFLAVVMMQRYWKSSFMRNWWCCLISIQLFNNMHICSVKQRSKAWSQMIGGCIVDRYCRNKTLLNIDYIEETWLGWFAIVLFEGVCWIRMVILVECNESLELDNIWIPFWIWTTFGSLLVQPTIVWIRFNTSLFVGLDMTKMKFGIQKSQCLPQFPSLPAQQIWALKQWKLCGCKFWRIVVLFWASGSEYFQNYAQMKIMKMWYKLWLDDSPQLSHNFDHCQHNKYLHICNETCLACSNGCVLIDSGLFLGFWKWILPKLHPVENTVGPQLLRLHGYWDSMAIETSFCSDWGFDGQTTVWQLMGHLWPFWMNNKWQQIW